MGTLNIYSLCMLFYIIFSDPLEQFEFVRFFSIFFSNFMYTLLVHSYILTFLFLNYNLFKGNNLSYILQNIISFIKITLKGNLYMHTYPHFFYVFYLFIYILICNLSGMIAYSFTVTSAIIITFFFSANFFIGANIYGFLLNSSDYFNLFIPKGVPKIILPMLFLIEIISYFSRVISLAVRLFANMMSGHALLKILLSFV